jgi:hypothetical protein
MGYHSGVPEYLFSRGVTSCQTTNPPSTVDPEDRSIWASAHERFFAAATEYFLVMLTDGERNATFSHFLTICQCVRYGFLSSRLLCALFC